MNIALIIDPYGEDKPGGLGRAIYEMGRGILESAHDFTVYLKREPKKRTQFERDNAKVVGLGVNRLWLWGGKKLRKNHDLYIFFTPVIPLLFFPKKSIVVVHDFAYLELPASSSRQKLFSFALYLIHWITLKKATEIVAVSNAAKKSIMRHFHVSEEKITVIYNGFISLGSVPEEIETPRKYFLFAGVLKERKNVHGVIKAFSEFAKVHKDFALLIAGKTGGAYADRMMRLTSELGVEDKIRFLGYVTDGQLLYLYTKAEALIFPSLIEGFGMPILEAMDKGLPVITSDRGALSEIAGSAALLANPEDPHEIALAMGKIASDPSLKASLREKGLIRAEYFSWDKNARGFIELIDKMSNNNRL